MQGFTRPLVVTLLALTVTGCATTMTVSSHVAPTADFARYRSYDWGPADALPTGDPRLDGNPFFQDYLQGAIERQLALKGLEKSTSGTPDLLIHYHANVSQRINVSVVDRRLGYCYGEDCLVEMVEEYEAGTLVLDMVDTRTNKVVWRGWAQDSVEGAIGNQDRMEGKIDEAIPRMLARLPWSR
jgi:hypothetical protein